MLKNLKLVNKFFDKLDKKTNQSKTTVKMTSKIFHQILHQIKEGYDLNLEFNHKKLNLRILKLTWWINLEYLWAKKVIFQT